MKNTDLIDYKTQTNIDKLFSETIVPVPVKEPEVVVAKPKFVLESHVEIQSNIDDFFNIDSRLKERTRIEDPVPETTEVVEVTESVDLIEVSNDEEETVNLFEALDDDDPFNIALNNIDDAFKHYSKIQAKEITTAVQDNKVNVIEEVVSVKEDKIKEDVITNPYMTGLVDSLSSTIKNNIDNTDPETIVEQKLQSLETQMIQVRQLFREATSARTIVSGIGQGGDGQSPGSGEVRILKMDDVVDGNSITDGDVLVWDEAQKGFVPKHNGSNTCVIVSDTPPPDVEIGDLWFDSVKLQMRVWYNDPDRPDEDLKWISVVAQNGEGVLALAEVSDGSPTNPMVGQTWFDSNKLELRVWYVPPGTNEPGKWVSAVNPERTVTTTNAPLPLYTGSSTPSTVVNNPTQQNSSNSTGY